jgi:hypothetical protein
MREQTLRGSWSDTRAERVTDIPTPLSTATIPASSYLGQLNQSFSSDDTILLLVDNALTIDNETSIRNSWCFKFRVFPWKLYSQYEKKNTIFNQFRRFLFHKSFFNQSNRNQIIRDLNPRRLQHDYWRSVGISSHLIVVCLCSIYDR